MISSGRVTVVNPFPTPLGPRGSLVVAFIDYFKMSATTFAAWLGLCELPETCFEKLCLQPFDSIVISTSSGPQNEGLTSVVLQVVSANSLGVFIHPFLHEFLCQASTVQGICRSKEKCGFELLALPLGEIQSKTPTTTKHWKIEKTNVVDLNENIQVEIVIIYSDNKNVERKDIEISLQDRIIRENSVIATSTGKECLCILLIKSIEGFEIEKSYRVGKKIKLGLVGSAKSFIEDAFDTKVRWERDCPGYEVLLDELYELCQTRGFPKPSGSLLCGCKGVGKSRLASCLAGRVALQNKQDIHCVSCHDLIMRASWASEDDLLDVLLPRKQVALYLLDDLQMLKRSDFDIIERDMEYLLVRNTIMLAIDRLVETNYTFILGICEAKSTLPAEFCIAGRLEKEIIMEPPSQVQRDTIIQSLLPLHPDWARALARSTAGFVAKDLQQMYVDAWANARACDQQITWPHLREAVHRTIPSQLTTLDVTRPRALSLDTGEDTFEYHESAWAKFGGYASVKKRIYRTVTNPWRRRCESEHDAAFGLNPPRGVLFHGKSGVGKTFAAHCLATSLGLNVVKVCASDVLDKWLGGSEAAIRSLFQKARGAAPCILFLDEIDAIASNRNQEGSENDVSSRILTTLLNELDGVSSKRDTDILVLACTNRLSAIDPALLRPGRLEEHIELHLPTYEDILDMLQMHFSRTPFSNDEVRLRDVAQKLFNLEATGADIEGICRDAISFSIKVSEIGESALESALENALAEWQ